MTDAPDSGSSSRGPAPRGADHGVPTATLTAETTRLLDFGVRFAHPGGGSAWLDETGAPDLSRPVFTWVTARMAHVYCLGTLLGREGDRALAETALAGLTGRLHDDEYGGWFAGIDAEETPIGEKACYAHAFVVLAASSGVAVGLSGARELLDEALEVWQSKFYDSEAAMFADEWDRTFTTLSPYRGVNGNMHGVEALLAAADALDDQGLRHQAFAICQRVAVEFAQPHDWRIPEHFDPDWQPMMEHNADVPDDPFQPYGATIGHGLEWSRLLLHVEAALGAQAPVWLRPAAVALFDRAVEDGWAVDGADGFVYTTDWSGKPVVRDRMHWVLAEAVAAGAALHQRTGDQRYPDLVEQWWAYGEQFLFDRELGSWHHQLDADNRVIGTVWPGKPDLYHAVQATLIPRLPLAPSITWALAELSA